MSSHTYKKEGLFLFLLLMLMYALDVFSKSLLLITCYFLDVITKVG